MSHRFIDVGATQAYNCRYTYQHKQQLPLYSMLCLVAYREVLPLNATNSKTSVSSISSSCKNLVPIHADL